MSDVWILEPRDPLIARDGKPAFTGRYFTHGFPFPSTIAGAVRTRLGSGGGSFVLGTRQELDELLAIEVAGPLLAEIDDQDKPVQWWAPAPRDAQFVEIEENGKKRTALLALHPFPLDGPCDELPEHVLLPVAASRTSTGKPPAGIPAFWPFQKLESWLLEPADQENVEPASLGLLPLPVERRTHVALQPGERVGLEGMLFDTAGLRFLHSSKPNPRGRADLAPCRLALGLRCPGGEVGGRRLELAERLAPLGAERRLAHWRPAPRGWPGMPAEIRRRIVESRRARLVLLTPACFAAGALPGWNGSPVPGLPPGAATVQATVRAACVSRPVIVSGWDLAADNGPGKPKGRPKPTRRLAPAGSVYFVELTGSAEEIGAWCDAVWLHAVSDAIQDRRDGFGLAVLGTWDQKGEQA